MACQDEAVVPAYVHLTAWEFETKPGEGSSRQQLPSAQVFVNGNSIGIYQVPITIPIAEEGPTTFAIAPVVKRNGMQEIEQVFPYFAFYRDTLNLVPTEEDTLNLLSGYQDRAEFILNEDFEGPLVINDDLDGDPVTFLERQSDDVLDGQFSGRVRLSDDHRLIEVGSDTLFANLVGKGEYWLEVDYKTNVVFFFGVRAIINGTEIKNYDLGVLPNEEWNKIYFDMTSNFLLDDSGLFQFVIATLLREQDGDEAEILIDNIKVVRTRT